TLLFNHMPDILDIISCHVPLFHVSFIQIQWLSLVSPLAACIIAHDYAVVTFRIAIGRSQKRWPILGTAVITYAFTVHAPVIIVGISRHAIRTNQYLIRCFYRGTGCTGTTTHEATPPTGESQYK